MGEVDYDQRLHEVYTQARSLAPRSIGVWCDAFERHLPRHRPLTITDVGSGAGRFTPALAERFGGPVIGVEPSTRMREVAARDARHPDVEYVDGSAEDIPLAAASCDGALLFFVWHHVDDRERAAHELARVVRAGGTLLVRTQLADRMPDLWWYDAYPRVREVDASMFEPEATTVQTLAAAGWRYQGSFDVPFEVASSRRAYLDRLRLRGISTFEHLTATETDELFAALEVVVEGTPDPGPMVEHGTLLVFGR